jgi:hypothetical protein
MREPLATRIQAAATTPTVAERAANPAQAPMRVVRPAK